MSVYVLQIYIHIIYTQNIHTNGTKRTGVDFFI